MDPFWIPFSEFNVASDFDLLADQLDMRLEIPRDVRERIDVAQSLIKLSYVDARLTHVAHEWMMLTFELALRSRFRELETNESATRSLRLVDLIKWAAQNHLSEDGLQSIDVARNLRNRVAHPEPGNSSVQRWIYLSCISATGRLINELYDDSQLRKLRTKETNEVNRILEPIGSNGFLADLTDFAMGKLICFSSRLLFIDNRRDGESSLYYVALWPIFRVENDCERIDTGKPIVVAANSIDIQEGRLRMQLQSSRRVVLDSELSTRHKDQFREWQEQITRNGGRIDSVLYRVVDFQYATIRNRIRDNQTAHNGPILH